MHRHTHNTQTHTQTHTLTDTYTQTQTHTDRHTQTDRHTYTHTDRQTDTHTHTHNGQSTDPDLDQSSNSVAYSSWLLPGHLGEGYLPSLNHVPIYKMRVILTTTTKCTFRAE